MKRFYPVNNKVSLLSLFTLSLFFLTPHSLHGQNGGTKNDVYIMVTCTEYIGDGTIVAYFGYENTGKKTVVVDESGSVVTYNHGQSKKLGLTAFEPGVKEKAFSQEFDAQDRVEWTVVFPDGTTKTTDANISSNHCRDAQASLNIIPGYIPPEGGKEFNSKIGAELTSLYDAYSYDPAGFTGATDDIFQLEGTTVLIEVVAETGQYAALMASLAALGFDLVTADPGISRATGWVEIGDLLLLNDMAALFYARPVYPGVSNYIVPATGLTKSQGDFAMHSDFARLGFDIDGSGVKIGVLSNSFNTQGKAHNDVINGDLPGAGNPNGYTQEVDVLKDIAPTFGALSDEGRAMLQIVHDIAPGAELAFRTGFLGEQDMARGIRELVNAGTDVIVDDLSYITEPFFRDGVISQTIDSVVNEGVTFFSSAGNFGRTSYTSSFNSAPAPSTITGTAHDFGNGDIFQGILLEEGSYTLVLQWDDGSDPDMTTTQTDLDIFLSDDVGFSLLGFNRENVGNFPIEVVPFSVQGDSVYANIVVARASGTLPVTFKYMLFRGGTQFKMLEYGDGGSSTIVGHPNASGAISVGAVRFDKNPVYNAALYPEPVIMSFSSMGGTPVNGIVRDKPDITAPNGVNTTIDLGSGDWVDPVDPDTLYPNFFGTSAASPHAAGVAALIMDAKLKYDSVSHVEPETIRQLLKSTAISMENSGSGYNYVSGSGFIQAHKALMTFANPTPYVENLILASEGGVPGESITPFSFTITGDFFTESTQVIFRGDALQEGVVIEDEHTITVDHPGFLGNPEVQVYNPEISESELDGGYSEGIYFSDPVRQKVVITANNLSKKYGEVLPEYAASFLVVTVDGDSLTFEEAVSNGIMLQEEADRLSTLSYSTPAEDTTSAGQYIIVPSVSPELDMANPLTEVDYAISEKYILEYVNGNLNIDKLALKITPMDMELVYGDAIPDGGIQFHYELGDSTVVITNPDAVLMGVQQEHLAALTNEIALVRGVALVNGIPVIRGVALVNGVTMTRGVALVNGIEVRVEVEGADTTVYVAGEPVTNGGTLIRGVALVNDLPFVNMTEIVRGVALVNGESVTFEEGYMTALNEVPLENAVPAVRGVALVNGSYSRGVALVNGHMVVYENGVTTIDGEVVSNGGIALVNGIPVVRGVALVNSTNISRGVALVNGLEVPIENGIPSVRGVALVNGIPLIRGTALVNNLEVNVEDGEVTEVFENGVLVNGLTMSKGIALVNGVALVNGTQLSRGVALVNGIALVNEAGSGEDVVNLENMNFLTSGRALVNGTLPSVRGVALVNGIEGVDGQSLKIAAGEVQEDGSIVYENAFTTRGGIALVNGLTYVRGVALVNGDSLTNGIPLVNGSTIDEQSNTGTILVFDATDVGAPADQVNLQPISFITGTTVGQHWIVPGTFLSNNFEITYGLGTLTIDPAELTISAEDKSKTYGEADPPLTYTGTGLLPGDNLSGALIREEGEDAGEYGILQGSLTAGDNYTVHYDTATFTINRRTLEVEITAADKVYDGTTTAATNAFVEYGLVEGDDITVSSENGQFDTKDAGTGKTVTADVFVTGEDAPNYLANANADTTASITAKEIVIEISAEDKTYDGNPDAVTSVALVTGVVGEDDLTASASNGSFDDKNVGSAKPVTADVSTSGDDAGNYAANTTAATTASITEKELVIEIGASDKIYDGNSDAATSVSTITGLVEGDDVTAFTSNGSFEDKNAGTDKPVMADVTTSGDDAGNYAANTTAATTASITAKGLVIEISATDKIYDGNTDATTSVSTVTGLIGSDNVTATSSNGAFSDKNVGTGKTVTADVLTSGDDAGNYAANTVAETTADITAKELVIAISAEDKTYDGTYAANTEAFISSGLVTGDDVGASSGNGLFADKNVGTWNVTADVSVYGTDAGNYLANTTATDLADITQREVSVTPVEPFLYIFEEEPLPEFAFIYNGWITGDAGNEGYTVLRDSDGVPYDQASSNSAGSYSVTPVPFNTNYLFTLEQGVLYVNPAGPSTKAVKPVLNCIEEISEGYYLANFEYKNDNDVAVFIPAGPDNLLEGSGIDWENSEAVPEWFVPGGGSFRVFFDGSEMSWNVTTIEKEQKVRNGANANSSSTKCNTNTKSAAVAVDIEEGIAGTDELVAYPNPVADKVHLSMRNIEHYQMIQLYDFSGRSFPITSIDKRTDNLEIDMEQLSAGHYFIRVVMEDSSKVVQIIKQ